MRSLLYWVSFCLLLCDVNIVFAEPGDFIPRRQTQLPGPPLSPQAAIKKMTLPPGFSVELVASEPQIMNPVAMTFDEKGRIWITESFEYPRSSAGPGRDRIKVLEDTNSDGRIDKVTVFAEGLNIPSGIAVGYGGVWVANAPDILFLQDTDGDGRADHKEVVVTGFGRTDTHELPNSLTWGPDGWLYGLNGVFNYSHVLHQGEEHRFTCALFRIHPRTHKFELFAEGTSNPWGVAWDPLGSAFLSACVIDHLWHLAETGYYHRQGGPYPPYTWKIESIVKHKHQMAAYCGIHYFDSEAYPKQYRDRLYMGNIHGNCINVDVLSREGSTYFARPAPDFLTANDVWFMPVVQKTGPDGCLYVLDWYDRYHCYQDARRDPQGIDRGHGRLYRIRYKNSPRAKPFDLSQETNDQLIGRLQSKNVFYRDLAQRVLSERADADSISPLQKLVLNDSSSLKTRLHALWSLLGQGPLNTQFLEQLLSHTNPALRAWGVRAAGNQGHLPEPLRKKIASLARDPHPDVQLQTVIAAAKIENIDTMPVLLAALRQGGDDPLLPRIVWANLEPLLKTQSERFVALITAKGLPQSRGSAELLPRAVDRILATQIDLALLAQLFTALEKSNPSAAGKCFSVIAQRAATGELSAEQIAAIRKPLNRSLLAIIAAGENAPLYSEAVALAASWGERSGIEAARRLLQNRNQKPPVRLAALRSLVAANETSLLSDCLAILSNPKETLKLRAAVLASLGKLNHDDVAPLALRLYSKMEPDLRPRVVELLIQRRSWSKELLVAIGEGRLPHNALNVNQVRRLLESGDEELAASVRARWGAVRTERDPAREALIDKMRQTLLVQSGDPRQGQLVFKKVCGQCHKMYGEGQAVGPDITVNGRSSFEQLLSNVFDPSLVIGTAYQATTLITSDGRVLTGLVVENNDRRIVLKLQGGKLETIARDAIEDLKLSKLSLMPEGLEKQLTPTELGDLFAFLVLDRPLSDPDAQLIPGALLLDPARIQLPKLASNHLLAANISSNVAAFGKGRRGQPNHLIFNPQTGAFVKPSPHHEYGVGVGNALGVISTENAANWTAEWSAPQEVNFIVLSGAYPNQPQSATAWKIEVRQAGAWKVLEEGVGGWYNAGRFVWGGPGIRPIRFDAFRVRLFSSDDKTPLKSIHFRGEENVSWFVGRIARDANVQKSP